MSKLEIQINRQITSETVILDAFERPSDARPGIPVKVPREKEFPDVPNPFMPERRPIPATPGPIKIPQTPVPI